jgi:CYTH domain-containing protein
MAQEIERKYLLRSDAWRQGAEGIVYRQGYLCVDPERTVRVRVIGEQGTLTIKGKTEGIARAEYEYSIPVADANSMLDQLCFRPLIEKTRYRVEHGGLVWEIDDFAGENQGLVMAEVELHRPDQEIELPGWVGQEVSDDSRYYNANLVEHPYSQW